MDFKSRTEKKKEAQSLQELGERLLKVSRDQMNDIEMPEELYNAIEFARTIKSFGALKRQMQYIGTLMRKIDPGPIREALDHIEEGNYRKAMEFKETEQWRDELIAGNKALIEQLLLQYPGADRQQLAQFVRNANKEMANNKPPKSSRALFRYLQKLRSG
ncbi:MAG: DUF615 domain-containing protein [Nitrospiraceae bacterium]|nr:MAG: DUF615 domain-containing protein [Nitrospiraceae bacterium]UCH44348.1 MAG: DUF615 domain-containing protein [Nitrospiraceae bacterium]